MHSDDELYRMYLSGDTAAYDELMIRHGDRLTSYLYGYLRNWQDAEDQMIEAFARIMAKKPAIREEGFKAYLYKTARNLAIRLMRRQHGRQEFCLDDMDPEMAEQEIADPESPESIYLDQQQSELLNRCMGRIDVQEREALYLVYMEGLTYKETAAVMHVTVKKIDHLLEKGKIHMRAELAKEGVTNAHQ